MLEVSQRPRTRTAGSDAAGPEHVARAQDLSRQFVQRMVNDAREKGWVTLEPNPAHRRSSLVRLTTAGEAAIRRVVARELDLMGRVSGGLTGADLDSTRRVLSELLRALDQLDAEERRESRASDESR